jgi:endonuclease YncB( thermonuclease family)
MARVYTFKDYLIDPNADPIAKIKALHKDVQGHQYLSHVDAAARASFSTAISITKGTFRFGSTVGKWINQKTKVTKNIQSLSETLIGTEKTDNFINFVDQVKVDAVKLYKMAGEKVASELTGDPKATGTQVLTTAARLAKLNTAAMISHDFHLPEIVRNALILDIETAGLLKDAPILQIAITDMQQIEEIAELFKSPDANKTINEMHPREQLKKGFLRMSVMPEAILRDTAVVDPATGKQRTSYKAFQDMPKSLADFRQHFGTWADQYSHVQEFYKEFAGEAEDAVISDEKLAEIAQKMKNDGFIKLANGQRIYSQREAAKWQMVQMAEASKRSASLIAANLPFESYRVGKQMEFFIRDLLGKTNIRDPYELAMKPEDVDFLNDDPDVMKAFGLVDDQGKPRAINSVREFRTMFAATWASVFKRNILDSNNFYYTSQMDKLRRDSRSNEMISLFPNWMRSVSSGLQTKDQLDLTRMIFSGLMQTDSITVEKDVMSGAKIDWASRAFFGVAEEHTAWGDTITQGMLFTEGKLLETTSDVYNVWKGQTSTSLIDHIRSFKSGTSLLMDRKKRGWLELTRLVRDSKIINIDAGELFSRDIKDATVTGAIREYNTEKELLRVNETIDEWTARTVGGNRIDEETLFTRRSLVPKEVVAFDESGKPIMEPVLDWKGDPVIGPDGLPEVQKKMTTVEMTVDPLEPFSLSEETGRVRHQKLTKDGRSLYSFESTHTSNLQEKVQQRYQELVTERVGAGGTLSDAEQVEVRDILKREVLEKYAQKEQNAARGHTGESLFDLMKQSVAHFDQVNPDGARGELRYRLNFTEARIGEEVLKQTKDQFARIHSRIKSGTSGITVGGIQSGLRSINEDFAGVNLGFQPSVQASGQSLRSQFSRMGERYSHTKSAVSGIARGISRIPVGGDKGLDLGARVMSHVFDIDAKDAQHFLKNQGKALGLVAGIAAIATGVGLDYAADMPSWKKSTGDILRMSGEEREILDQGRYEKSSAMSLSRVTRAFTGSVDQTNPDGVAMSVIDSSKVDFAIGDGDTIQILTRSMMGGERRSIGSVRISGMDAPEVYHRGQDGPGEMPGGQAAKQYLKNVMSARTGAQIVMGENKTFGRGIGLVTDDSGINYSYQMVEQGLASVLYREKAADDITDQKAYNAAENVAKKSNSGMWNNPFYTGGQSGIPGGERKGWNTFTPSKLYKFGLDEGPGSTQAQMAETAAAANTMGRPEEAAAQAAVQQSSKQFESMQNLARQSQDRKAAMASAQQDALAGSMQKNRGRGKERR